MEHALCRSRRAPNSARSPRLSPAGAAAGTALRSLRA